MNAVMFLLACLIEEFGEVQQINGKIVRFGMDSFKPSDPDRKSNRRKLVEEINDIEALIRVLKEHAAENPELLPGLGDEEFISKRIDKFMHFANLSMKNGLLDPSAPLPQAKQADTPDPTSEPQPA